MEGHRATTETSYRSWLLAYMKAEIDAIVVTDHNTHEGIGEARDELIRMREDEVEGFREICIFAGVEITVEGGYHLLGVFDVDTDSDSINGLLYRCGFDGPRGESLSTTSKAFAEVVREIEDAGGLAIPAHADAPKGLFGHDQRNQDAIRDAGYVIAIEAVTEEGVEKAKRQGWASVLGSDSHFLDGAGAPPGVEAKFPGSHFTWMKMETPNLLGVKLALSDETSSVLRSTQATENPGGYFHPVLDRVIVKKGEAESCYVFGPWMNAIIGGRGVGKSTVVEVVRLAMGRHNDLPAGLRDSSEWFSPSRGKGAGARFWDQDTIIEVHVHKLGRRYRILWNGESPENGAIESFVDGEWIPESGSPRDRFPLMINSQKQIYETARDPQSLLKAIDDQPSVDYVGWKETFDALKSKYRTQRASISELSTKINSESRLKGELADAEAGLKQIAKIRDSAEAKELDNLLFQQRCVDRERSRAESIERALLAIVRDFKVAKSGDDSGLSSTGDTENEEFASKEENALIAVARSTYEEVRVLSEKLGEARAALESVAAESPRKNKIQELEHHISASQVDSDKSDGDTLEDPNEANARLVKMKGDRLSSLEELKAVKERRCQLEKDAQTTLEELCALRGVLTARRAEVAVNLNSAELKLNVLAQADASTLERDLRRLVNKPTAYGNIFDEDGLPSVLGHQLQPGRDDRVFKLKELLKDLRRHGASAETLTATGLVFDQRFYSHLETLDGHDYATEIDLWFPEDLLRVQYRRGASGKFHEINQGSPGEKTAALLAVILQLSNDPLLLDQPEDDLDNKLIYDLVVSTLKRIKSSRQIIVVTHNANVVVNADSEHVTILSHGPVPRVEAQGSIQIPKVKESICLIMEGGESAFEARYRRLMRS